VIHLSSLVQPQQILLTNPKRVYSVMMAKLILLAALVVASLFTVDAVGPLVVGLSFLVTVTVQCKAKQSKGCDVM
jgi:hypothetical protein